MSDYEQSRYARAQHPIDTGGTGAFWFLVVVVALGVLFLIMALGGSSSPVVDPAASADPVITPAAPDAAASDAATGAATGTAVE